MSRTKAVLVASVLASMAIPMGVDATSASAAPISAKAACARIVASEPAVNLSHGWADVYRPSPCAATSYRVIVDNGEDTNCRYIGPGQTVRFGFTDWGGTNTSHAERVDAC